ncbi:MAG: PucR family transcriptional regulator [Actinomycetes bacterium]
MSGRVVPLHGESDPRRRGVQQGLAAVAEHVLARLDGLLPAMGTAYRREIAEYAAMPSETFDGVLATSRDFVARFCERVRDGEDHVVPDRARLLASGRARMEAGISLDATMHAFRIASREGWTAIADAAEAVDPAVTGTLAARWIEYADRASTAFAEGHAAAHRDHLRRVDARRQALVADLLAADDAVGARAVAARHGATLASSYVPVVVEGSADPVELDRLAAAYPGDVLLGLRGDRSVLLVPRAPEAGPPPAPGAEVLASFGRAAAPGPELSAQVAAAESTLTAAREAGRTTGWFAPEDLLLSRVVREHTGLRDHLRDRVVVPLADADRDGIFRDALRAYLACGSVPRTAEQLIVHANTVTYRLNRVRDLTGLDPRVPVDATLLTLALALEETTP